MAYLEQSTRYVPYTDRPGRPLEVPRAGRADGIAARRTVRRDARRGLRGLRALDSADGGALPREISEGAGRFRRRVPLGDSRQGARHAARAAAGGDDVERRALRQRPGIRGAAAADVRASPRRGPRVRAADARRAAQGDSGVSRARRSADPRRPLDRIPGGARAKPSRRPRDRWWMARAGAASRSRAHRFRSGRRGEGGRRRPLCGVRAARRSAADDRARALGRRPRGAAAGVRRARARTAATSPAARSSAPAIASTSSPTTARSATSSGTVC